METFVMVHPSLPECIGDAPTLAAWAADGWKRKEDRAVEESMDESDSESPKVKRGRPAKIQE